MAHASGENRRDSNDKEIEEEDKEEPREQVSILMRTRPLTRAPAQIVYDY